jgi:formyl-CoA transferase
VTRRCAPVALSSKCNTPQLGSYLTVGRPIKFSDMDVEVLASPLLGELTDEVLQGFGYNLQQIDDRYDQKLY